MAIVALSKALIRPGHMGHVSSSKQAYVRNRPYPEWKVKTLKELEDLIRRYETIIIFDLKNLSASVLHHYRRVLRKHGVIKVFRNKLVGIALKSVFGDSLNPKVSELLSGENGYIFTNENPFELYRVIVDNSVRRYAVPGDTLETDIVVPSGNTGINPGPVLSRFSKLRIPTQIRDGKIWVVRDTPVAKPGDKVTPDLADLLRLLDIKPIYESIRIKAALVKGRYVISRDELIIDVKSYFESFKNAHAWAFNLAVNAAYPTPETLGLLIARAVNEARNLAINANLALPETIGDVLAKAQAQASRLAQVLAAKAPELGLGAQQ